MIYSYLTKNNSGKEKKITDFFIDGSGVFEENYNI